MTGSFQIVFDYALQEAPFHFSMMATVVEHHSIKYYVVSNLKLADSMGSPTDALPEIEILPVQINGQRIWVHRDSQKETALSMAVGKGIDEYLQTGEN